MADIITIDPARRRHRPVDLYETASGSAQILFFTGVRYERHTDVEDRKGKRRKVAALPAPEKAIGS